MNQQHITACTAQVVMGVEAGIDGIKLAMDGVEVGATLKFTTTNREVNIPPQRGGVAANGHSIIPVTHRKGHYITIFSQEGLHCENMPTKVGKGVVVKDDVYVREFPAKTSHRRCTIV